MYVKQNSLGQTEVFVTTKYLWDFSNDYGDNFVKMS